MGLILIRHGETDGNRQRYIGWEGIELNDTGRAQAMRFAEALVGEPICGVLSSPLVSALATAKRLAAARDLAV